jgi:hypothetical protein
MICKISFIIRSFFLCLHFLFFLLFLSIYLFFYCAKKNGIFPGGDLTPRPYRYGPPHPPLHHQQMHYPPAYPPYSYYGQHHPHPQAPTHQELCYPYYPPKYYQPNSPYTRRPPYVQPSYYQPAPLDYRPPPQPPVVPQNAAAPSQIVPAAPTPTHIDPHYSSSPYYTSYANAGTPCYSQTPPRNLQPPAYLGEEKYEFRKVKMFFFLLGFFSIFYIVWL